MSDKYSDEDKDKKSSSDGHDDSHDPSRRRFIKNTGMVVGGVVGGSLLGGLLTDQWKDKQETKQKTASKTSHNFQEARQFFTRLADFHVLAAATEQIYPKDHNGPGAIELGVPYFIDKQLAGPWGFNARDYRKAPFMKYKQVNNQGSNKKKSPPSPKGAQGQDKKPDIDHKRNQSRLTRGEIFIQGVRKMNEEAKNRFKTTFDKATDDQQMEILKAFENGEVAMNGTASENFFILLRQATLEGAYADPLYGGNKNMQGWEMKEFPGAYPSFANVIEKDEFFKPKPMSLMDSQGH